MAVLFRAPLAAASPRHDPAAGVREARHVAHDFRYVGPLILRRGQGLGNLSPASVWTLGAAVRETERLRAALKWIAENVDSAVAPSAVAVAKQALDPLA